MDLAWWITGIAVPLVTALVIAIVKVREAAARDADNLHKRVTMLAAEFHEYKEKAAEKFCTLETMRHVENRLGDQMNRIEDKLDKIRGRA